MIFNNINFNEIMEVNDVRRYLIPPQEIITKKIPGKYGGLFVRKDLGQGLIEVDVAIIETNLKKLRIKAREIAGMLHTKGLETLEFLDEPDKFYNATLTGESNLEEVASLGEGTLYFLCPDPLAYSKNLETINLANTTTIDNKGTYETTGIIVVDIKGNRNHLEVLQVETGEKIYIEENLKLGDVITINLRDEYVKKNGILIMDKLHVISDFFKFPVGTSTISLSSDEGELNFRRAWL